jgi:four helix bundle protein
MVGAGTSIGANVREASEALSRKDFAKALGIALKELAESRYWLEFVRERNWIKPLRLGSLEKEGDELARVLNVIVARTKANTSRS